jgi:hypothetical protein
MRGFPDEYKVPIGEVDIAPGAMEAHLRAMEAHPVDGEARSGSIEAPFRDVEAPSRALRTHQINRESCADLKNVNILS